MSLGRNNHNELATRNINTLTYAHRLLIDGLSCNGRTEKLQQAYKNLNEAFYAAIRAESERIVLAGEQPTNTDSALNQR